MNRRLPVALSLSLGLALLGAVPPFSAKVVGVSEGDNLTVLHGDAIEIVQLYGIDAPENSQPFGTEAEKFLSDLASGKTVSVRPIGADSFGDTIAEVVLPDGRSLAQEMVKAGLAWWDPKAAPEDKLLERLQAEAKAAKRGLWSKPDPVPPWEWENPVHVKYASPTGTTAPAALSNTPAGAAAPARAPGPAGAYAPNNRPRGGGNRPPPSGNHGASGPRNRPNRPQGGRP